MGFEVIYVIDWLLMDTYKPKGFGIPPPPLPLFTCFCMEFAANLQYTLINTGLTRFFPHPPPPPNKVEVLNVCKICNKCLTCNSQHCPRIGGQLELHFPHLKHKVSQTVLPGLKSQSLLSLVYRLLSVRRTSLLEKVLLERVVFTKFSVLVSLCPSLATLYGVCFFFPK